MTDSNVENLNIARADKTGDNRHITARDLLEDLIAEIDRGEIAPTKMVIFIREDLDESGNTFDTEVRLANIRGTEALGLVELVKLSLADDIRDV